MFCNKVLSNQNLDNFNYEETKKKVNDYFEYLEKLKWEFAKLNIQKGLTANYDFSVEYKKQPYSPISKDDFNLSNKDYKKEQLKKYMASYYWAKSILSDKEQTYIHESFINRKCQEELLELFGYKNRDNYEFRQLRRSAVFKFADFLNLVVKEQGAL